MAMERAWKKDVFSGPRPVLPGGTNTSMGARAPAFAGAATCVCMRVCVSLSSIPVQAHLSLTIRGYTRIHV